MTNATPQTLDEVSNEELLEVLRSLALEKCAHNLERFASSFFSSHLTITMPRYHADIYRALSSLIDTPPATPPEKLEIVNRPSPKSLQFSKVPDSSCNNLIDNASNVNILKQSRKSDSNSKVSERNSHNNIDESSSAQKADNAEVSEESGVAEGREEIKAAFRNSVVVEPREFGKSTKAMIFVMWALIHRHKKFVLYISKSHDHAVKLVGPIKREFEANEMLRDIYGDQRADKWTEGEMEFQNGSKLLAVGRGQTVRGLKYLNHRPDLVILDDIEDDESVNNKELRLKLHEWLDKQVIPGVDSKRGTVSAFGTILHPSSLLAELSASENRNEKYANFLSLFYGALDSNDRSIWEEKFSTEQLLIERKRDFYTFAQERMNQPIPIGSGMFKRDYFKYFKESDGSLILGDGTSISLTNCNLYMTCDIAMTTKEYSDYTVLLVTAVSPSNHLFVLDYTRERWEDPDKIIAEMFRLHRKYPQIRFVGVEEVQAQRWLIVNLRKEMERRGYFEFSVRGLKADKDKLRRISQLQPRFENGSVHIKAHMSELEEELMLFPKSAHDDVSDALAYVLQLAQPGEAKEEETERRHKREPYKFSISGEEVLKRLENRGKPTGIFKEYAPREDFDPYENSNNEHDEILRWMEE